MASAPTTAGSTGPKPNVARAGGIMMVSLLLSRVLGLVRESIAAGKFGSNDFTDAYRLAFTVPDLLFFLIAGGALSSAFIPVFSEYLHTDREDEAWHVFSVVATVMSLITVVFISGAMIFSEQLVHLTAPGKVDDNLVPFIAYMSRIVLPSQFAFFIGGLMFGTLYARQVFAVPGLGPNIYNLGIIIGAVVLSGFFTPGVIGMSWGALIGAFVGNIVVPAIVMAKLGAKYRFSLDLKHPGVKKVFRLMMPVVLGLSLPGVYALIMQGVGSYYASGVNTVLDNGNKLMQVPLGVFGQSMAIGVFPALSQFFAQGRMDLVRSQLTKTMGTVIYLTVPIAVLMAILALPISAAMFRHGAFTLEATRQVAACLQWFAIGIPAWCLHPVLMRGFFAIQDSKTPILLGTLTTAIFVGLVAVLRLTPLGYLALPLSSSLSALALVVLLTIAVRKKMGGLDVSPLLNTLTKSLIGSVPVAVIAGLVAFTPLAERIVGGKFTQLATVGVVFLVAAWAYVLATKAMGMSETEYVTRAVDRIKKKVKRG
ncbi:MAG: murein biosynthesis integral membrane protein MurJ [Fimbriimonas sp.]